ncbi:hypothetical protein CFC21_014208 [Triticum aestivum]|uniref:Uncharacterized protein n=2 Tax=Triticum aestivum TaxID=4565 RepID=A0A9R1DUE1_WHEAT|nr:uncharacterized protein LOC123179475 [Triticum aestivum]KAF6998044.1 hypothetical protein CFC21_014204 [Triticum aestivum]KAF6998049.1 hypothetical protein CFC21_014208 [Triticum aestivum]
MSAALRSAARMLGRGSLLQRTGAEGLFSPSRSRLVHTREHAPTDLAREIQQKKDELRSLVSKAMRNKVEVYDVLGKADKNCETLGKHDTLPLALQYRSRGKVVPKPHATLRTWMRFATRADALLEAAAHATIFALVIAFVVSGRVGNGVKAQTVNEENQGSQD